VNLVRAEVARLFGRRFTKIMLGVVVLLLLVVGLGLASTSHKHNAQTRAQALAQIQQMREQNQADVQRAIADCQAAHDDPNSPNKFPPGVDCSQIQPPDYAPTEENVAAFEPHQFVFRTNAADTVMVLGFLLALLGFAVGASFVGAEWSSGGMMNLLLWRPRRVPLLLGKLGTLLGGMLAAGIVLSVAWVAAVYGIASVRGDASRITRGLLTSLALTDARALALMLFAAALGFGIASLGRNTATALGLAVGYVIVLEIGTRIVLNIAAVARPERFFLSNYMLAWLAKSQQYVDDSSCRRAFAAGIGGQCEPTRWALHMNQSAVLGGVLAAAFVSFRRRDIT
jgi:ABC-2 type transport system permease protein